MTNWISRIFHHVKFVYRMRHAKPGFVKLVRLMRWNKASPTLWRIAEYYANRRYVEYYIERRCVRIKNGYRVDTMR